MQERRRQIPCNLGKTRCGQSRKSSVTSINYKGAKIDNETLKLTARLFRIGTDHRRQLQHHRRSVAVFLRPEIADVSLVLNNTPITRQGHGPPSPAGQHQSLHLSSTKISDRGLDDHRPVEKPQNIESLENESDGQGDEEVAPAEEAQLASAFRNGDHRRRLEAIGKMADLHRLTVTGTKVTPRESPG